MFIDASALVAMMTDEDDAGSLASRLESTERRLTSPVAVFETTAAVARVLALPVDDVAEAITRFLRLMRIELVALPAEVSPISLDAFARYGKGQGHAAQLNMGDCFAYACARHYGQPLLVKGTDFSETDIDSV